jgi:hypothetical protein
VHLDDWYAQAHPDEDFAETFAVWLTPDLDWRARYRGWKAIAKLEYVDELMRSLAGKPPTHQPAYRPADYDCLNVKLKTYYAQAQADRRHLSRLLRQGPARPLPRHERQRRHHPGQFLPAQPPAPAHEFRLPLDQ